MSKFIRLNNSEEIISHIILDNFLEYIWIINLKSRVFNYISPSFANLNNLIIDDFMKMEICDLFSLKSKNRLISAINDNLPQNISSSSENIDFLELGDFELITLNNQSVYLEISVKYFLDSEDNTFVLFSAFDITNRKMKEDVLNNELNKKNQFIDNFLIKEQTLNKKLDKLKKENEVLLNTSIKDKLTGIYNRQYFDTIIIQEVNRSKRYSESLSMIFFDIDHFKNVNDTYGHKIGDDILKRVSFLIKNNVRNIDSFIRWGGEEFVVLLPNTSITNAEKAAYKLKEVLENEVHPTVGKVTASFAVSQLLKNETVNAWFLRVDSLLYEAKNSGRNCVKTSIEFDEKRQNILEIHWKDEWSSGNKVIDFQHKFLINQGNNIIESVLSNSPNIKILLEELIIHTKYHFAYEESVLKRINFEEFENHKKIHQYLLNKSLDLVNRLNSNLLVIGDILDFFVNFLIIGHIEKEDSKFFHLLT